MKKRILPAGLLLAPLLVHAQSSRIDQVLVYPGGATVERVAAVKAGARQLRLACLPSSLEERSLQVRGEGVAIGEITVIQQRGDEVPECANPALDTRMRELEDQVGSVNAEIAAHEVALAYLRGFAGVEAKQAAGNAALSTADVLRRGAQEALNKQQALRRRVEALERELKPLKTERDRRGAGNVMVYTLLVQLAAEKDSELRVRYETAQAGWQPHYRAYLDTATGRVRLERHAQVAQASGEDWSQVRLRLATTQPRRVVGIPTPQPWTLDIQQPQTQLLEKVALAGSRIAAAPAPAPAPFARSGPVMGPALSFDLSVFEGEFGTEFEVPGLSSVQANTQRAGFVLGQQSLQTRLSARTTPATEAAAYLVAESARPAGVWPAGALQLFRDGTFVGSSRLALGNEEQLDLFFGRDELIRVSVEPQHRNAGSTGFISSRVEQRRGQTYRIENLHKKSFSVQVLEASPVARHEDIQVQAQFDPKPADDSWRKQPGVVAWTLELAPGQQQKLSADYLISYPKDARINGLR